MSLEEKLEVFREIEGFLGVGIYFKNGKLIASGRDSGLEMDIAGGLINNIIMNAGRTTEELGLGWSNAIDISTHENVGIFIRCYSDEKVSFNLILICEEKGQIGMIRLLLNQTLPVIVQDMSSPSS